LQCDFDFDSQFIWAPQGRLRRDDDPVQLRVEGLAVKKRVAGVWMWKEDLICAIVTVRLL
jgi:hypothetical protein